MPNATIQELRDVVSACYARMGADAKGWVASTDERDVIGEVISGLDAGDIRPIYRTKEGWGNYDWVRQAILLYFRIQPAGVMQGQAGSAAYDKIPLKTTGWMDADFKKAAFRMVPGAIVRRGAHIAPNCVIMPSFINIGAFVGEGTMIDTWATVGSCAQVGRGVHISGGVGLGGVLEPLQAKPVIIGNHAFIGARSEIAEGVEVGEGAVIAMGTFISASTKIVDRATGQQHIGYVPPYAVVVPGTLPSVQGGPGLACGVIVKTVDERTRAKTGVNELLRAA